MKLRIIKLQSHCVIPFGFRKGKTNNFSSELYLVFFLQKKPIYFYCVPWFEEEYVTKPGITLEKFCCVLVRVGVPQVAWAVRYLDKLQCRAVKWTYFTAQNSSIHAFCLKLAQITTFRH